MERLIAVIGDGEASAEDRAIAERVGRLVAEAGCVVVCGGLGGVMEAACKGAAEASGLTVGILPGDHISQANRYVKVPIVTGLGEARNVLVVKSAGAVIAVGGRYGTLSEIALALKIGRPVIGLGTWELARAGEPDTAIVRADTPEDAVVMAVALAEKPAD